MTTSQSAFTFIEQQLDQCVIGLENIFQSDVLSLIGGIVFDVDDTVRNVVEKMRQR